MDNDFLHVMMFSRTFIKYKNALQSDRLQSVMSQMNKFNTYCVRLNLQKRGCIKKNVQAFILQVQYKIQAKMIPVNYYHPLY